MVQCVGKLCYARELNTTQVKFFFCAALK